MADNWLASYGYNALLLPRRDLHPNDVLWNSQGDGFDRKAGGLSMVLGENGPLPGVTVGEPVGDIGRTVEKKVELSLGLKILGSLLGAATASKLGADTSVSHASKLVVSYDEVEQESVAILELQAWLDQAKVIAPPAVQVWLNDEKLAVVTAVLRSAKLSIVAETANGASIDLSIPEIQGLISGEAKVEVTSASSSKITFSGPEPIAFGFQALVLNYEGNVLRTVDRLRLLRAPDGAVPDWAAVNPVAVEELADATAA